MDKILKVIGSETDVLFYNLNKQFSNVKKVIITSERIINSFEDIDTKAFLIKLKETNKEEFFSLIKKELKETNLKLRNELYKLITDELTKLSNTFIDVKLNNYNFMNSISNTKYNLVLRTNYFTISEYFIEKGTILTNIKKLLQKYFSFNGNYYLKQHLLSFQIEITEAEEIEKHILLKKESNKILLLSGFGFPMGENIDHISGTEIYISEGERYNFFKNKQNEVLIREHNQLKILEIKSPEKILTNEELIEINKRTSKMDDTTIECYFNIKNQLRIINVSINENNINRFTEHGIILEKSNKNYDRISILSLRDNLDEDSINPKYLLLKNSEDIKQFLANITVCDKIDGIILTINYYSPIFDLIKKQKDIDIIFINKNIKKSLDEELDLNNITIHCKETSEENPFSSILKVQNTEKDTLLEKLKNIDLNEDSNSKLPTQSSNKSNASQFQEIANKVNQITSSSNSSFNQTNNNNINNNLGKMNNGQKRKTALEFLYESALEQSNSDSTNTPSTSENYNNNNNNNNYEKENNRLKNNQNNSSNLMNSTSLPIQDNNTNTSTTEKNLDYNNNNNQEQTSILNTIFSQDEVNKIENSKIDANTNIQNTNSNETNQKNALADRYENILATKIITSNQFNNEYIFIKSETDNLNQTNQNKEYFQIIFDPNKIHSNVENNDKNINFILPINLNRSEIKDCYLLIRNLNDFFLIEKEQPSVKYFINLINIPFEIKKLYLKKAIQELNLCSIICNKEDLNILEELIDKIEAIVIDNLENNDELLQIKQKILTFEKRVLLKNR